MVVFQRRAVSRCVMAGMFTILACIPCRPGHGFAESGLTFSAPEGGVVWTRDGNPAGKELSWDEAHDYLRGLNTDSFGGCAFWRLPVRDELTALLAWLNSGNADGEQVSPEQDFYWSATTDSLETGYAYAVNMGDGSVDNCKKSDFNYVWPVCGR